MRRKSSNIYYGQISYENIDNIWKIVRRTCKNKNAIFKYSLNKNTNNYNIYKVLLNCEYKPYLFRLFLIFEPKERLVMSQTISDKIVNHFIANYYLLPLLEKKLIDSNVATRIGKGSKYAEKLMSDYVNTIHIKEPLKEIFVLKIDISKYFYNINHDILLNMLKKDIKDDQVINIIKVILDETNKPYINKIISKLNSKYNTDIPFYQKGVGLSIGAMTSQFLAIYYLNDLDHFIKEKLDCKYYIRYMDDFIILDTDKSKLREILRKIEIELEKLKLSMNPKSSIISLHQGINFLGFKYKIDDNKFRIYYRKKTIGKIKKKLAALKKYDLVKYYKSYGSYYGYLKKINKDVERVFKMTIKERYDYYKKDNKNSIVFLKVGSFYKTFADDAKIIWNLFNYKWNSNSIGFGIENNRVFEQLKNDGIGYITINSDDSIIEVNGSAEIYVLYSKLAQINYDKYTKKEELHILLDKVFNIDNYCKIKEFLQQANAS